MQKWLLSKRQQIVNIAIEQHTKGSCDMLHDVCFKFFQCHNCPTHSLKDLIGKLEEMGRILHLCE